MKKVLFVARNITSVNRLLDVVSVLRADLRVEFAFAVDRGSEYAAGVDGFLRDLGVRDGLEAKVVSWEEAVAGDWDVAVAAHVNAGLRELPGRLVVLPHGAGYNRLVPPSTGGEPVAAGLSRHELTYDGVVVPDRIGVSHPEQVERLGRACPEVVGRAVVVGDPCRDRIVANLPRRDLFRRALGAGGGRRLVAMSSTWNDRSLLAADPELPKRLVARLPVDEYQVVLVMHPNVWTRYGPSTVRSWYADALDSGLLIVPPRYGWQAALIAADWIIGDHGSVTFYGAALDLPALVTGEGAGELDPASPLAELAGAAPRWDPDGDPVAQLEAAHAPGRLLDITGRGLGAPGEAARLVRDVVYELLDLATAEPVRVEPLREPPVERGEVTAYRVESAVDGRRVTLRRYPYALARYHPPAEPAETHLAVEHIDTDRRLLESADVLLRRDPPLDETAAEWAATTLRRYPGCRVVAVATGLPAGGGMPEAGGDAPDEASGGTPGARTGLLGARMTGGGARGAGRGDLLGTGGGAPGAGGEGWLVVERGGGAWVARVRRRDGRAARPDPALCGPVAYALLTAGRPPDPVCVVTGEVELVIDFPPPPRISGLMTRRRRDRAYSAGPNPRRARSSAARAAYRPVDRPVIPATSMRSVTAVSSLAGWAQSRRTSAARVSSAVASS